MLLVLMAVLTLRCRPFMVQFAFLAHFSLLLLQLDTRLLVHHILYIIGICVLHLLPQPVQKIIVKQLLALDILLQLTQLHMVQKALRQLPSHRFRRLDHLINIKLQGVATALPYRIDPVLQRMFDLRPLQQTALVDLYPVRRDGQQAFLLLPLLGFVAELAWRLVVLVPVRIDAGQGGPTAAPMLAEAAFSMDG